MVWSCRGESEGARRCELKGFRHVGFRVYWFTWGFRVLGFRAWGGQLGDSGVIVESLLLKPIEDKATLFM